MELTRQQATQLSLSKFWEQMDARSVVAFQLTTERCCIPFEIFKGILNRAFGRQVLTHELTDPEKLLAELLGKQPAPTLQELVNAFPREVRYIFVVRK